MQAPATMDRLLDVAARRAVQHSPKPRGRWRASRYSTGWWWRTPEPARPLSRIVRNYVLEEGGRAVATILGGAKVPARAAALANGTISHALDYDDTHFAHVGHLSVGIMPAALGGRRGDRGLGRIRV